MGGFAREPYHCEHCVNYINALYWVPSACLCGRASKCGCFTTLQRAWFGRVRVRVLRARQPGHRFVAKTEKRAGPTVLCYPNPPAKYDSLRKGRELGFTIQTVTLFPVLDSFWQHEDLQAADVQGLPGLLQSFSPLPLAYEKPLNAALQRVSTLRPTKKRTSVAKTTSRGAILKRLEQEIANLDQWQKAAAIGSPEGPQRIRGIAGSGKTVVLALKAAYLHAQNPTWTIVVTFYTRSLYQQFKDLIRRFTFEHLGDEPDWQKLRVMHAWGAGERDGVYKEIALNIGAEPRDFLYGQNSYGRQNAFSGLCGELLAALQGQEKRPLYDAVLIDEAQDLPESFFRLVYEFTRMPKRIIWAYDELQNLSETATPPPESLFGKDADGRPHVKLSGGGAPQDIVLPICYRNTPWALTLAHALGFGIYRREGLVQHGVQVGSEGVLRGPAEDRLGRT